MVGRSRGEDIKQPNDLMEKRSPNLSLESICCARGTQVAALHQHMHVCEHWELCVRNLRILCYAVQLFLFLLILRSTHYTSAQAWCQLGTVGKQQLSPETAGTCQLLRCLNQNEGAATTEGLLPSGKKASLAGRKPATYVLMLHMLQQHELSVRSLGEDLRLEGAA